MRHQELFLTAAIAASVALSAPMVNAEQFNSPEARALAAAQESPAALRHFVDRTRMIYALSYNDYARPDEPDADITAGSGVYASTSGASSDGEAAPDPDARAPSAARQKELDQDREQLYRDMLRE